MTYITAHSVFMDFRVWLMLLLSVVLPFCIYGVMLVKRAMARSTVLMLGLALVAIAGLDVFVLQTLATASRLTPSLVDDAIFLSEMSTALYFFPAMFGGIGVNVISHVLIQHLVAAEARFAAEHRAP